MKLFLISTFAVGATLTLATPLPAAIDARNAKTAPRLGATGKPKPGPIPSFPRVPTCAGTIQVCSGMNRRPGGLSPGIINGAHPKVRELEARAAKPAAGNNKPKTSAGSGPARSTGTQRTSAGSRPTRSTGTQRTSAGSRPTRSTKPTQKTSAGGRPTRSTKPTHKTSAGSRPTRSTKPTQKTSAGSGPSPSRSSKPKTSGGSGPAPSGSSRPRTSGGSGTGPAPKPSKTPGNSISRPGGGGIRPMCKGTAEACGYAKSGKKELPKRRAFGRRSIVHEVELEARNPPKPNGMSRGTPPKINHSPNGNSNSQTSHRKPNPHPGCKGTAVACGYAKPKPMAMGRRSIDHEVDLEARNPPKPNGMSKGTPPKVNHSPNGNSNSQTSNKRPRPGCKGTAEACGYAKPKKQPLLGDIMNIPASPACAGTPEACARVKPYNSRALDVEVDMELD